MIPLSGPTGRLTRKEVLSVLAAHAAQNQNADPSLTVKPVRTYQLATPGQPTATEPTLPETTPPAPPPEPLMPSTQAETDADPDRDWLIGQLADREHRAAPWAAIDVARLRALAAAPLLDRYPDWSLYLRGLAARLELEISP